MAGAWIYLIHLRFSFSGISDILFLFSGIWYFCYFCYNMAGEPEFILSTFAAVLLSHRIHSPLGVCTLERGVQNSLSIWCENEWEFSKVLHLKGKLGDFFIISKFLSDPNY